MLGWIRTNIIGGPQNGYCRPDPDFGSPLPGAEGAEPIGPSDLILDPRAEEERFVASAERLDQIKEGLEAALHPHEPQHLDIGGGAVGFVRGVLIRVLAHVVAYPGRKERP